ncbi:MAG: hypothetical protein HOP29_12180 [Phycisphaerales bacterium]|nr:hypothetical protein [Phycisphaerales bacterium]
MSARDLNVFHVANVVTNRHQQGEDNRITVVCQSCDTSDELMKRIDSIKDWLSEPKSWTRELGFRIDVDKRRLDVRPLGGKTLFISTRFDWTTWRDEGIGKIPRIANRFGFNATWGGKDTRGTIDFPLAADAEERIAGSDAFILILPQLKSKSGALNWALYEYGYAKAKNIPCAICVDTTHRSVAYWTKELKVGEGRFLKGFDNASLWKTVSEAIAELGRVLAV